MTALRNPSPVLFKVLVAGVQGAPVIVAAQGAPVIAAALWAPALAAAICIPLGSSTPARVTVSPGLPACLTLQVDAQHPVQVIAGQPADVELRIYRSGPPPAAKPEIFDTFDFGPDTATLVAPGAYRIEIALFDPPRDAPPAHLDVTLRALPPGPALQWHDAEVWATRSKHSLAASDIAPSRTLWEALGETPSLARTLLKDGDSALDHRDADTARTAYVKALDLCSALSDFRCIAEAANNAGTAARRMGDVEAALGFFDRAASAWQQAGGPDHAALTLSNLGLLYWQISDYQSAIATFYRADRLLTAREPVARARVWNNLGLCYSSLAQYDQARTRFREALAQVIRAKSLKDIPRFRMNYAFTLMMEGTGEDALPVYRQALAEAGQANDPAARADILNGLGHLLVNRSRFAEARTALREALEIHSSLRDRRMESSDLHYLGVSATRLGDPAEARDLLTRAFKIRTDGGQREFQVDSYFALADLERSQGRPAEARDLATRGLDLLEEIRALVPGQELRASWSSRRRDFIDFLVQLEMGSGGERAAEAGFLAVERGRGRALRDLLSEGRLFSNPPEDLLRSRTDIGKRTSLLVARLAGTPPEALPGLRAEIRKLVGSASEVEAAIRQQVASPVVAEPLASVARLCEGLPPGTALLEFHLGTSASYLWLIGSRGLQSFLLPPRQEIEAAAEPVVRLFPEWEKRQEKPLLDAEFRRGLAHLSEILLTPLHGTELPPRLVIVPDGTLLRVPFAALELSRSAPRPGDRFLGLQHDLVMATSAAFLLSGPAPQSPASFPKAFLGFSDPVTASNDPRLNGRTVPPSPGFPGLQGAARLSYREHIDTVFHLVSPSSRTDFRGFEANVDRLKNHPLSDYAVIELSAHAMIDDRLPELSRIALSLFTPAGSPRSGFVTPVLLSDLHFGGSTVVLSACETALGKQLLGEGLSGFTASLFRAGAAQLVLSLAPVDAEATSHFFSEAYGHVFGTGRMPVDQAMTRARRSLADSRRWSDPWFWASFMLYGRPSA